MPPSKFLPPFLSPILLRASLGPFNSVGADLTADGLKFRNPNRTGMLVDQIRFAGDGATLPYWSAMAIEVRLGSIPLTKSTVTLASLAPRYLAQTGIVLSNPLGLTTGDSSPAVDKMLTWHLLKPLYVPPGVPLIIRAIRQEVIAGSTAPGNVSLLNVSVVGRSLPANFKAPKTIDVPWVAETKVNAAVTRYVSLDSDLINPHSEPLNVRQFIGSNYTNVETAGRVAYYYNPAPITVQMTASNGTMFIRDPVPFYLLFPTDRCALNVEAKLQPGEFFRAELEIQALPTGAVDTGLNTLAFTSIAMHGYRNIPTPEGVATP